MNVCLVCVPVKYVCVYEFMYIWCVCAHYTCERVLLRTVADPEMTRRGGVVVAICAARGVWGMPPQEIF